MEDDRARLRKGNGREDSFMKTKYLKLIAKATAFVTVLSMFASIAPARAATLTSMSDVLTRLKVSTLADHEFKFVTPTGVTAGQTIVITLPSDFSIAASLDFTDADLAEGSTGNCSSATFSEATLAAAPSGTTWGAVRTSALVYTFTSGTGTITAGRCVRVRIGTNAVTGATGDQQITNATTAGSKTVTVAAGADSGTFAVAIVTDDQVSVTASVDPSLTFNVGAEASATACAGTFAGNGGTVALGTLTTGAVASSDASSVNHICSRVSTNAGSGAVVTVKSTNAALKSTSTPADVINSATATLVAGTSGYGLCAGSAGADSGKDSTTPTGATPARVSPFNGTTCTSSGHDVGALTTSAQNAWTLSGPSQNAFFRMYVKAAISATVPAHNDYTDTLTFVATGTF